MRKQIKILTERIEKLQQNKNGTLDGGFASIKGGFKGEMMASNTFGSCTNTSNCTASTNTAGQGCSNSGTCFF